MGFTGSMVENHSSPQNLYGYQGDKREQKAEIVLRRKYVGGSSNDIGFALQEDGTYGAVISDYDRGSQHARKGEHTKGLKSYNQDWLDRLAQRYAYNKVKSELSDQGFYIEEEREEGGELYIEVTAPFGG